MTKIRLTDVAVQKLKTPEKGRAEIMDDMVPGLCLRITDKNHKSWSLGYRFNGKRQRLTIEFLIFGSDAV